MTAPRNGDRTRRQRLRHFLKGESWILRGALLAVLPSGIIALILIWIGDYTTTIQWTLTTVILLACIWFPAYVQEKLVFSLRNLANMVSFLREQDYTVRLTSVYKGGALDQLMWEVNALRDALVSERTGAAEASALLDRVMAKIDVAVFTFDGERKLRLLNSKAAGLLAASQDELLGREAAELGLAECLEGDASRVVALPFGNPQARWEIRRAVFREDGRPHELLVLSDLTAPLRREELHAWQRLVRVLRHELSNGLTPIQSFGETLLWLLQQDPLPESWRADLVEGLEVIRNRAAALNRMVASYKGISGMPVPRRSHFEVSAWIHHGIQCETRMAVKLDQGPECQIEADRDQLDQLLINLIKNGVEASSETGGKVTVGWEIQAQRGIGDPLLHVWVDDEGPGLASTANLFVPFFSTKPGGTGTGLIVCRQIAEAHGGSLDLVNHQNRSGCRASLILPL